MSKEEFAKHLADLFPEKELALQSHYSDYGELLGHVFFAEEINIPLVALLKDNSDLKTINKYCKFIEEMWDSGSEEVVNIIEVTILERLSDDNTVWKHFGGYISKEFKTFINETVLRENLMMTCVPRL